MINMTNRTRDDLKKYITPTKIISFHCNRKWLGKGTAARDFLLSIFLNLITDVEVSDDDIEKAGWILGYELSR